MIRLALAFLLGTLAGLAAHLALGYLWPVRVEWENRRAARAGLADLAAGRVRPWSEVRDGGYGVFV